MAFLGLIMFSIWLVLFGGGILIDSRPYREAIDPNGVRALDSGGRPVEPSTDAAASQAGGGPSTSGSDTADPTTRSAGATVVRISLLKAWLVTLTCFLPLNLAWLCVAASTLGAFGNRANLSDDSAPNSQDSSNPFLSALLRGFFVYLFMMSGLLVLDDAPFTNAGPSQYVRLAGFLSLFSFVVSYQPRLFTTLIASALLRIQARGTDTQQVTVPQTEAVRATVDVEIEKRTTTSAPPPRQGD